MTKKSKHYKDEALLSKVASLLKTIRLSKGYTQEVVYNKTDVHIGRIESGKINLTISSLKKICDFYGIELEDFFSEL